MDYNIMEVNEEVLASIVTMFVGVISWFWVRSANTEKEAAEKRFELYKLSNEQKLDELMVDVDKLRDIMQSTRETYMTRPDFQGAVNRLMGLLERIETKIDCKQSVTACEDLRRHN